MSALGDGELPKYKFLDLNLMDSGYGNLDISHLIDPVTLFTQMEWKKGGVFRVSGASLNRLINLMRMGGFTYFEPFVHKYAVRLSVRMYNVILSYCEKSAYGIEDAAVDGSPFVEIGVDGELAHSLTHYYTSTNWTVHLATSSPHVTYHALTNTLVALDACYELAPMPPADPTEMQGSQVLDTLIRLIPDLQRYVPYPCHCSVAIFSSLTLTTLPSCPGTRGEAMLRLQETIIRLNDVCGWSRERVADWIESLPYDLTFPTPEEQQLQLT